MAKIKILNYVNIRRSFVAKVCFWVMLTTISVYMLVFGVGLWFAEENMLKEGHNKANLELDKALLFIDEELSAIEVSAQNIYHLWPRDRKLSADETYEAFNNFLDANPHVRGIAVGFEADEYPEYAKGFSPCLMDVDGRRVKTMLGDKRNYHEANWYRQTKLQNRCRWSDPFWALNGGVISSYCIPLHNSKGKFIGVVAVDISHETLTEKLQSIKPYPHSQVTMMDRQFKFIAHPEKKFILRESAQSLMAKANFHPNESIFVDMKRRHRGIGVYNNGKQNEYVYYAPVKKTDWTVTLECSSSDILRGVKQIRQQMVISSAIGLLGLLFAIMLMVRRLITPLKKFSKAAISIAGGNFHTKLPYIRDHNELWNMGCALDRMQQSLDRYIQDLKVTTESKGRIESELRIASNIQMAMIPKTFPPYPERDDVEIFGSLIPAKEIGGDLYDFFIRDNKLFFCIGDVSGKGIPAALVMAVTRSLVRIVSAREDNPARIVSSLNDSMSDMNDSNMFVTIFVGVLDLASGRLCYCNGGHNAPVIAGPEKNCAKMLEVEANLPVAVIPNMRFKVQEIMLKPDSTIFLYTDGLTEAENQEKELFGDDRMIKTMEEVADLHPKAQIEAMTQVVAKHVSGAVQSDDLTMLSIRCRFKNPRGKEGGATYGNANIRRATFHNTIKDVPTLGEFIDGIAEEEHIDMVLTNSINLALEEAVVNVMKYAYPEDAVGTIVLESRVTASEWTFVITDSGKVFDPTKVNDADVTLNVEERPIGGLGIFLVRQIMDSITYERVGDFNVLTLVKKLDNKG